MARARRGRLRRVLRVLLRTLAWTTAALVVVIVAAVSVVLWTPWGTRTALRFALERYDAAIPGSVELQRVGGTIGGTLTLDGLVLRDAAEHPLVAIGHVETRLRLGALVGRVVAFDHFDATAVELHVGGGQAEFLDLAPPREEPPPPTPGLVGPDLPIGFDGPVGIDAFTLWQHADTGEVAPLLHGAVVRAHLRSHGREALLRIDALSGVVDVASLTVAHAHGRVTWSDPRVQLDDFGALTDRGFVEHARVAVDLDREAGEAALATVIDPIALALQLGIAAAPPLLQPVPLRVSAGGTLTQTWAAIDLAQDDRVAARLLVGGALQPELQLAAVGHAGARLPPAYAGPDADGLSLLLAAAAHHDPQGWHARAVTRCIDCGAAAGASAELDADPERDRNSLEADAFVADASVHAELASVGLHTRVDARVDVPAARRVLAALSHWLELPAIDGSARAHLACSGARDALPCQLDATVEDLAVASLRVGRAHARASVTIDETPHGNASVSAVRARVGSQRIDRLDADATGSLARLRVRAQAVAGRDRASAAAVIDRTSPERTIIAVQQLVARLQRLNLALLAPTHVRLSTGAVAVAPTRVAVARGVVAFEGTLGEHSRASLAIEQLDLAALEPLRLPVALRGRLEARAWLEGSLARPGLALIADAGSLAVDDEPLGRVGIEASLAHGRAQAHVMWQPGGSEQLELRASAAVGNPPRPSLRTDQPLSLALVTRDLTLARAQRWAKRPLGGELDLTLHVDGTAAAPRIVLDADGRALRYDELELSSIVTHVEHRDGRVDGRVELAAPWLEALHVGASVPLRITGAAPWVAFDADAEAAVDIVIDHLELAGLETIAPGLQLRGGVDGSATVRLHDGAPELRTGLLVRGLEHRGHRIATATLDATLDADRMTAALQASGAAARLLELDVDLPLRIDPHDGAVAWLPAQPLAASLELRQADVAALAGLAGITGIAGRIDGELSVDGTPRVPQLQAALHTSGLVVARHELGRVDVDVRHADAQLVARLRQQRGRERVQVDADVPITVDLVAGAAQWQRNERHDLSVDAVAVDDELLAAFVALPAGIGFTANLGLELHGTPADFRADGRLRADLDRGGGPDTPVAAHFAATGAEQELELVIGPFEDKALTAAARVQVPIDRWIAGETPDVAAIPIVASLDATHFPIAALGSLMPSALSRPAGRLDLHARADGTLGVPALAGSAALRGGAITIIPLRQRFDSIEIASSFDGADIVLDRARARSAAGRASAKGQLHLQRGNTTAKLSLALDGQPIVRPGLPLMKLTTRADATLDATGERTEVDVVARKTTLDVFTASATAPDAIPESPHVTFVDRVAGRSTRENRTDAQEPMVPSDLHLRVRLADPVFVRGPQANMTWRGGIELTRGADEEVRAQGAFVADRGRVNLLGHDFVIDSARITMPERGELDPYIQLTAITQTDEGTVTADVHGRVSRPVLRLSSDPPLPESAVFALLVTGKSGEQADGEGGSVEAKAASLLAAFENPVLQRALQDRLGIDRVGLAFGDSIDQPIVAVGKRVSKRVYLETRYHHNAPINENHAEIHLEYSIKSPSWSLETFIGDAAKGAVEVWWRRRFGKPRPPATTRRRAIAEEPPPRPTAHRRTTAHRSE